MTECLNAAQVRQILIGITTRVMKENDKLNSMDSACGDGDFGTSMWISFSEALKQMNLVASDDIGLILLTFGKAIVSSAGGAAGPIFGSFFIEAGKAARGKEEVDVTDLSRMFDAALNRIKQQGGAKMGDKTVVDALEPAVGALRDGAIMSTGVSQSLKNAANGARVGYEATKGIVARHGKARYLGEQTLGYVDPGAYVMSAIFEEFAKLQDTIG